jgi:hypothetical protein
MCFRWRWTSLKTDLYGMTREWLAQDDQNDLEVGNVSCNEPIFFVEALMSASLVFL